MSHEVETMFSVREKPWHYELTKDYTKILQEAPNSSEALIAAGLNWHVVPKEISLLGDDKAIPNAVANVRDSDGKVFGVVTSRYQIVQNDEAFAFTDTLLGGGVRYETAGSLFGGKKVWLLAKISDTKILGDNVEQYLCFTNTHDGTGSVRVMVTPVRVVCNNTLNLAVREAKRAWSVRHVGDINAKIKAAQEALGMANSYMQKLAEDAERYADIKIDYEQTRHYLKSIFGDPDKAKSEREKNCIANSFFQYEIAYHSPDIKQFRGTGWGAINAMADMVDHATPNRLSKTYAENNWGRIMNGHADLDAFVEMIEAGVNVA